MLLVVSVPTPIVRAVGCIFNVNIADITLNNVPNLTKCVEDKESVFHTKQNPKFFLTYF